MRAIPARRGELRRAEAGGLWAAAVICWLACVSAALLLGCTGGSGSGSSREANTGRWDRRPSKSATSLKVDAAAPDLRILAGSELKELEPDILNAAQAAGLTVGLTYAGTLEMVDRVNAGDPVDAILPPSGAYPSLALTRRALAKEKLFYSRVALGVKASKAKALGWDRTTPSWSDVTQAVRDGKFAYAMTHPTSSNTGMSALLAVAASSARKTEDLAASEIDPTELKDFLTGQKLTAGSSGWLADAYVGEQDRLDGLINYEAVLLRLSERPQLHERLTLIYPRDGVISADYPLMLLAPGKRAVYDRLVAALKAPAFQSNALERAFLRPSDPTARRSPRLSDGVVAELSFPNNLEVIDAVLASYQAELRRPATSIYLMDVSGSMRGARIAAVKSALELLTGVDARPANSWATRSTTRYARFQNREHVMLIPFAGSPWKAMRFNFENEARKAQTEGELRDFVEHLRPGGGSAIYSTLDLAYDLAYQELARYPGRAVTVVLLTDGQNNNGLPYEEFRQRWSGRSAGGADPIRTFPILFGEASSAELDEIARLSGGRSFDGRSADLREVFREIRGYQ
jgi:Ca-activated chloride channel homolog